MSFEEVHVQLREHDGNDGESYKIIKEVVDNLDPDAKNVVFFMEMAGDSKLYIPLIDSANRGEITYKEAMLRGQDSKLLASDNEYPLLNSLSLKNWGENIANVVQLLESHTDNQFVDVFSEPALSVRDKNHLGIRKFWYGRAAEYDKLRELLKQKGKTFIVIPENTPEIEEELLWLKDNGGSMAEYIKDSYYLDDPIEKSAFEIMCIETKLFALSMARDEICATLLKEKVSKLVGKTEIFTHFGTLHKYLPEALEQNQFKVNTEHGPISGYAIAIYGEIRDFIKETGTTFLDLSKNNQLLINLSVSLFEKYKLEQYISLYISYFEKNLTVRQSVEEHKKYMKAMDDYPAEMRAKIVNGWIKYRLENN